MSAPAVPWVQLVLEVPSPRAEELSEFLTHRGALAVSMQDAASTPIYEPPLGETPLWPSTRVTGLFPGDADLSELKRTLSVTLGEDLAHRAHTVALADQAWERAWMSAYRPMRFGSRLWVGPAGSALPPPPAVGVFMEPGLAFGSGTHATTGLCLEWLDAATLAGKRVVDYGAGSGILALAAAKLGAGEVWAVDVDPQALTATRANAERNGVSDLVRVVPPGRLRLNECDVLLANILARPLLELAPRLSTLLRPGGELVLSGILVAQGDELEAAYGTTIALGSRAERDGWLRLSGRRRKES